MSNRAIFITAAVVAGIVAVVVYRGASSGAANISTALANGLGRLTTKQKAQIGARTTARSGRGHF